MMQARQIGSVDLYGIDLYGGLRGPGLGAAAKPDSKIKDLQSALTQYANAKGGLSPGPIDGLYGPKTRDATMAVIQKLPKIPDAIKTSLMAAYLASSFSPSVMAQVDDTIKSYASQIASGVRLLLTLPDSSADGTVPNSNTTAVATAAFDLAKIPKKPGGTSTVEKVFSIPTGKSWYNAWWGMGLIGLGVAGAGYGAYKLVR